MRTVLIKKTHPAARLPMYATAGASCFDLHACLPDDAVAHVIAPGEQATIGTGIAVSFPFGHVLNLNSRSGHAANARVSLANGTGKVDADYRGEIKVILRNDGTQPFIVRPGDRIAQAEIVQSPRWAFTLVTELDDTVRGTGGFGSTGQVSHP